MSSLIRQAVLKEGVTHIEELPLNQFITAVETLKDRVASEKADGANLNVGFDEKGFFTSREGKRTLSSRCYSASDYAEVANFNAFRGAHEALAKEQKIIKKYLTETDLIEVEVMFGRQPNTVVYGIDGKNFIVILRGIGETPMDRVTALSKALNGKSVKIESLVISSSDGRVINREKQSQIWEFATVAPVKIENADITEALKKLDELKKYLEKKNDLLGITNKEAAELSLTSITKADRPEAKIERDKVNDYIMRTFKIPIKEVLLNDLVRNTKSFLQAKDLDPSEDIGIEGVVVRDPVTGSQLKIVDKDVFTAINTFNSAARGTISGLVKTIDSSASPIARGGIFGEAKIKIAKILGNDELALSGGLKRLLKKLDITNSSSACLQLANELNLSSPSTAKTKISTTLAEALEKVDEALDKFKEESKDYKLTLKTGKTIGYSPEVVSKTLIAFAEVRQDIEDIHTRVLSSKSGADLIAALYGKTISSILGGDIMTEGKSLLKSIVKEEGDAGTTSAGDVSPNSGLNNLTGPIVTPASGTAKGPLAYAGGKSPDTPSTALAQYPFKVVKGKMVVKRKRNYQAKSKFAKPVYDTKVEGKKFSLLKSIVEASENLDKLDNATNVDDTIQGQKDVQFTQLRNTVNMGSDLSPDDVYSYLDKAAEINDEPDSTIFGLEMNDGAVVKIYVDANQTEEFEKALGEMIGNYENIEEVIEALALNFDIIDVEWPEGMEDEPKGSAETPEEDNDQDDAEEESPEIDLDIHDDEVHEEYVVESFVAEASTTFTNQALQAIQDILIGMGFDCDSNRSFNYQARQLQSRNTPGVLAARNGSVVIKFKAARDALSNLIQVSPGSQPPQTAEEVAKEGELIEEGTWSYGDLKSAGISLKGPNKLGVDLDTDQAEKLLYALKNGKPTTLKSKSGKKFEFQPTEDGKYFVYERDKPEVSAILGHEDMNSIINNFG